MVNVETNFQISFDKNALIAEQGLSASRILSRPKMASVFEEILKEIPDCIAPMAIWDSFPITGINHNKLVLENGFSLGKGPLTDVMVGASDFVAAVCTVGPLIDQKITEYQHPEKGEMLKALMVDSLASYAVGQVRNQLLKRLKEQYIQEGKHVTVEMQPGESEWDISEQTALFELLHPEDIGIHLNDSMLMVPMKSISFVFGAGEGQLGVETGTHCQWCLMKDKCEHYEHPYEMER